MSHRPRRTHLDEQAWAARSHLLASTTPEFDTHAALRGIEDRLRQRRWRCPLALTLAVLLPCGMLLSLHLAQRSHVRQASAAVAMQTLPPRPAQPSAQQALDVGRGGTPSSGPHAPAARHGKQPADPLTQDSLPPPQIGAVLLWHDDWDQQLADAQEMLLALQQSWHSTPDAAAALKVKLDGLEADLAENTL